jgi:hypothetical protein
VWPAEPRQLIEFSKYHHRIEDIHDIIPRQTHYRSAIGVGRVRMRAEAPSELSRAGNVAVPSPVTSPAIRARVESVVVTDCLAAVVAVTVTGTDSSPDLFQLDRAGVMVACRRVEAAAWLAR